MNILSKKCIKCKQEKPVEQFSKNRNTKNGYCNTCKTCVKEYQLSIKDKLKVYQQGYQAVYRKENADKLVEYDRQWRKNNVEKCRAHVKASKARNPEKYKEYQKQWRLRKKLEMQPNEQ
jgi:hypothetical protein